ncbi:hypothetical protein V3528_17360, partial [Acinetobacter johnsonii]
YLSRWQMNVMSLVITPTKNQKTVPVQINLDRMKSALSSEVFVMPKGLTREEKRRLILEAGKK